MCVHKHTHTHTHMCFLFLCPHSLLPQPLKCWDYRCAHHLWLEAFFFFFFFFFFAFAQRDTWVTPSLGKASRARYFLEGKETLVANIPGVRFSTRVWPRSDCPSLWGLHSSWLWLTPLWGHSECPHPFLRESWILSSHWLGWPHDLFGPMGREQSDAYHFPIKP